MRLALAQINPLVGDLAGNGEQLLQTCRSAAAAGADLVVAPELALWGYPPRDLLLRPALASETAWQAAALGAVAFVILWRTRVHLLWVLASGAVLGAMGWV